MNFHIQPRLKGFLGFIYPALIKENTHAHTHACTHTQTHSLSFQMTSAKELLSSITQVQPAVWISLTSSQSPTPIHTHQSRNDMIKEMAERVCIIQPQHDKTKQTQLDSSLCPFLDLFSSPEPLTISPNGVNISFFLLLLHLPSWFCLCRNIRFLSLPFIRQSCFFFFFLPCGN